MFTLSISQLAAKLFLENAGPRSSELLYVSQIDGFKFRLLKTETTSLYLLIACMEMEEQELWLIPMQIQNAREFF